MTTVNKILFLTMGSFSDLRSNNIGNTGGIRFAAKCEPQKRNANRVKYAVPSMPLGWYGNPKIFATSDGNTNSMIPIIDMVVAAYKYIFNNLTIYLLLK